MDDHDLIARSARDVLEREFARDALHALVDGTEAEAQKLWDLAVRMGWPGVAVQEELGGLGLDARAAVALLKEYGRAAAPGALFSATVAALWSSSGTADAGSLKDVATRLARGELRPLIPGLDWSTALELDDGRVNGLLPGMIGGHGCDSGMQPE